MPWSKSTVDSKFPDGIRSFKTGAGPFPLYSKMMYSQFYRLALDSRDLSSDSLVVPCWRIVLLDGVVLDKGFFFIFLLAPEEGLSLKQKYRYIFYISNAHTCSSVCCTYEVSVR